MTRATPEVQRQVLLAACEVALAQSGLDHPLASEALEAVREGRELAPDRRDQLGGLAAELDRRYSTELEKLAEADDAIGEEWKPVFKRALAASVLWFATSADPIADAHQIVGEAWAATDWGNDIPDMVEELLVY